MTDPTPRCPWCSAELPAGDLESCPSCKATLSSPSGAEPDIKGVTSLDPLAIIQARAEVARPRNRIMSFITGDVATGNADPAANASSLAPPPADVRREMRRLEIEAEVADLEAESVALKTDVVVEMGISLSALAGADADLAAATAPADEAAQVEAEQARLAAAAARRQLRRQLRRRPGSGPGSFAGRPRRAHRPAGPRRRGRRRGDAGGLTPGPGYARAVSERLPHPGPSFLREQEVRIGDRRLEAGMAKPVDGPDDWWLAVLWVTDADGVVSFRDVAPAAGPPPEPPLARLGPSLAGGLSGLIREEDGRLAIRLTPLVPPEDDTRPVALPAGDPRRVPLGARARRDAALEPDRRPGTRGVRAVRGGAGPALTPTDRRVPFDASRSGFARSALDSARWVTCSTSSSASSSAGAPRRRAGGR